MNSKGSNYKRVTMIEDLPELKDIEEGFENYSNPQAPTDSRYDKFIREQYTPLRESGMLENSGELPSMPPPGYIDHQNMAHSSMPHPNMMPPNMPPPPGMMSTHIPNNSPHVYKQNPIDSLEGFTESKIIQKPEKFILPGMSCLDIANHVEGCPICSKFYKNSNTLFLIIIFILSVFCLILLKKVLDM